MVVFVCLHVGVCICVSAALYHTNFDKCGPIVTKLDMEVAGIIPAISREYVIGHRNCEKHILGNDIS